MLKIILLVFAIYLACELGFFFYKLNHLPVLPNIDQSDKSFGSGPTLRYIVAGDSAAVGLGASSLENTYAHKVAQELAKNHTVTYKNIAVVGYRTKDVLNEQVETIIAYKPDVVVISMGGNDATHLVGKEEMLNNYKAVISKLKERTSAKIYITTVPNFYGASILPRFYIELIEYRSRNILNPLVRALEDERVKIVNNHDFGWDSPPYNDRAKTYSADHFHPNDLGYQNWTNAFLSRMIE